MQPSGSNQKDTLGRDLKRPDYSVVNAEIVRNWKRRKGELKGIEKEQKHNEMLAAQEKIEAAENAAHQKTLDEKGRSHEISQQQRHRR